jgi:signal transduction histidine kinase
MSIRTRLALLVTLLVIASLAAAGIATYKLLRIGLLAEVERDVERRAAAFALGHSSGPYYLDVFSAPDVFLQVVDRAGQPVVSSGNLGDRVLPLTAAMQEGRVIEARVTNRPLYLTAAPMADGRFIVVARSPITIYGALRRLRQLLYVVVGVAAAVAAGLSWLVARTVLRPVERVAAAASAVKQGRDLRQRVSYTGPPDEVGRLARTFDEMLAELEKVYTQLDDSNQQLRRFLADCAHELRAPLTLILSSLDMVTKVGKQDPTFAAQALADIRDEANRMARMITQLLILGRADAGAVAPVQPILLGEVVADAVRQGQGMANGRRVINRVGHGLDDVVVRGNSDYLKQLLLILLDNACRHTPHDSQITIDAALVDGRAKVAIADTGAGIPEADLPHIFDRFYRGSNARGTGTGLGLAIAQWIAQQHGGEIEVSSAPGRGSRFTVVLPVLLLNS